MLKDLFGKNYLFFSIVILLGVNASVFCQTENPFFTLTELTNQIDTTRLMSDEPLKSPMGAVYRSAVIPGWGQVYTENYLKAGLAASINGFFIVQILNYQNKWKDTHNQDFRDKRNQFTWYLSLSYLLTLVDAYVNAYLYKFDTAMEISHFMRKEDGKWLAKVQLSLRF